MSTAVFYDLENISKFTTPRNFSEFKDSFKLLCESELVDDIVLQRAYISTTHPAYIKYNRFLNSTGIEICAVDPNMNSRKANLVDFKMNVDCVAYALSNNVDTVVIATGDADFGFLCEELKAYGKKVVVASYGITTNKSIIILSDDWVDFSGEYVICNIRELMNERIKIEEAVDYKDALKKVLSAMLNDKLIKRYMSMDRFDLSMLREFTEQFYKAPELKNMSYAEFVSLLIPGIKVNLVEKYGQIMVVPSDEPIPEPPLNLYELVSGIDYDFSAERFRAWHSWFEENIDSVKELIYYINFMIRNKLLVITKESTELVSKRKCVASLLEHTSNVISTLNIKPEEKELEKLRSRLYRNALKHRPTQEDKSDVEEEPEEEQFVQGTMTNFGRIVVYADDEAVTRVDFTDAYVKYRANNITMQAMQEIREYFKGERQKFTVPVKIEGSEFQKAVLNALCDIPYGETRTYKQIAEAIGRPNSAIAIGSACSRNKLLFIVPCHRVIRTSGNLSGYAAGTELKTALLKAEASPTDFKRFGKQYTYNVKHPESRAEYRSADEIFNLLDSENNEPTESDYDDVSHETEIDISSETENEDAAMTYSENGNNFDDITSEPSVDSEADIHTEEISTVSDTVSEVRFDEHEPDTEVVSDNADESVAENADEADIESVSEEVVENIGEDVVESISENSDDTAVEGIVDIAAENIGEDVIKDVVENAAENAAENISENVSEAVVESAAESVVEPAAKSVENVDDASQEQDVKVAENGAENDAHTAETGDASAGEKSANTQKADETTAKKPVQPKKRIYRRRPKGQTSESPKRRYTARKRVTKETSK